MALDKHVDAVCATVGAILSRHIEAIARSRVRVSTRLACVRWTVFVSLALCVLLVSAASIAATSVEAFVQTNIDRSYALLRDPNLGAAARQQQFATQLRSLVDTNRVALFTLGPYARDASKETLDEFTTAFGDFLTTIYQQALNRYKTQRIKVTGSIPRATDDVIVNAAIGNENEAASELHVAFRVRSSATGGYVITDMQAEGIWLAVTERADFTSYLQQHGGNLTLLSGELHDRASAIRTVLAMAK